MQVETGDWLKQAMPQRITAFSRRLKPEERDEFPGHFDFQAHEGQLPPGGDWRVWLVMAGRGFGKTRAGAEWVRAVTEADGQARVALVAASLAEARAVMVEGECWLIGEAPSDAWADHAGQLACWSSGDWLFAPPRSGMRLLNLSTGQLGLYRGGAWSFAAAPTAPSGGTTVDAEARAAIAELIAALADSGIIPD